MQLYRGDAASKRLKDISVDRLVVHVPRAVIVTVAPQYLKHVRRNDRRYRDQPFIAPETLLSVAAA
jgi:hypothetical protein